jgi:rod shape-determining protein MreB
MRNNLIAIDMGSVNTNIYKLGEGLVLAEPSAVALTVSPRGKVKAVGTEAKRLFGKTAGTSTVVFPISEGLVSDEKIATKMMETFINKITLSKLGFRPQAVVAVPCGVEGDEIKKYEKVLNGAGVYSITYVESPILTAIGLNIPISESTPCFVVDLGGGTTNIAAVSLDGVIAGVNVNMGGRNIDAMIIHHMEEYFGIKIGMLTAERIKIEVGSLLEEDSMRMEVNGSDVITGKPRSVSIGSEDVLMPIRSFFDKIFEITEMLMAKLPAEVSAEVRRTGIFFAGGTSKMPGLEYYAREVLAMRSTCFDDPENATVVGGGIVAGDRDMLKKLRLQRR